GPKFLEEGELRNLRRAELERVPGNNCSVLNGGRGTRIRSAVGKLGGERHSRYVWTAHAPRSGAGLHPNPNSRERRLVLLPQSLPLEFILQFLFFSASFCASRLF